MIEINKRFVKEMEEKLKEKKNIIRNCCVI